MASTEEAKTGQFSEVIGKTCLVQIVGRINPEWLVIEAVDMPMVKLNDHGFTQWINASQILSLRELRGR